MILEPIKGNAMLAEFPPDQLFVVRWTKDDGHPTPERLDALETQVEQAVLEGKVLVLFLDSPLSVVERAGVVPLRWGARRILVKRPGWQSKRIVDGVMQGDEPVRVWRLWRYKWCDATDLLASARTERYLRRKAERQMEVTK